MKILSASQLRSWDEYTISSQQISSLDLMERAARACFDWLQSHELSDAFFMIFCGKGNNGGDGLALARMLAEEGNRVEVYILEFGTAGTQDFESNLARLHQVRGVEVKFLQEEKHFPEISSHVVVIDALYGTGMSRPVTGIAAALVLHINSLSQFTISIDLPSGLVADGPTIGEAIIKAIHTLSFQVNKRAFLMPSGEAFTGRVHILDIGLADGFCNTLPEGDVITDHQLIREIYKKRKRSAHKGNFGHSLIIAGSYGKMGAAVLCVKSCLHAGTGLLTTHVPGCGYTIMQLGVPEAMALTDENNSCFTSLETQPEKFDCIGIGPGLGTEKQTRAGLRELLTQGTTPMVIDADAFNILATEENLMAMVPPGSVLTPHPKEFDRLFGESTNDFERVELARRKANELKMVIVLKGHHSYIAVPVHHRGASGFFNSTGNPGMATGGSGDVLTGILTSLIAQGYDTNDAAILGVYLHGLAGDLAASALSEESLSAGDIINFLPPAFQHIGNFTS